MEGNHALVGRLVALHDGGRANGVAAITPPSHMQRHKLGQATFVAFLSVGVSASEQTPHYGDDSDDGI